MAAATLGLFLDELYSLNLIQVRTKETMSLHTYLLFVSASLVLCLVPGPDMLFLLGRTIAQGRTAVYAPRDATVKDVLVKPGSVIVARDLLVVLE